LRTPEGLAALAVLSQPGVWKRAGLAGGLSGLDVAEAMARLPDGIDRDFARRLLTAAETPWLAAAWEKAEAEKQGE